ncbi:hypothetical protein G5V57_14910 [Nordella sp. HKS 07]|uniref:hypothetical protein n=1 Tax=Nordella sp. HKS 07 TaxID=2712222 RepID=UPI0013E1B279|nr:hypothetical protein [Nordella sp. HKS 07]QIG48901.1 hypothetical protein G5V57_14910 [Nordella sp. HKS 07]
MRAIRLFLSILGVLMVLLGLVWIGQGSGYFPYPASSFMINQTPWIYWGSLVAVAGVIIGFISRRLGD